MNWQKLPSTRENIKDSEVIKGVVPKTNKFNGVETPLGKIVDCEIIYSDLRYGINQPKGKEDSPFFETHTLYFRKEELIKLVNDFNVAPTLTQKQREFIATIKECATNHKNRAGNFVYMWSCNCHYGQYNCMTDNFEIISEDSYHSERINRKERISLSLCEGDLLLVHCDNDEDWQKQLSLLEVEV